MDQEISDAFADIREQLVELRSALGTESPTQAEQEVEALKKCVGALASWGITVTPPFQPPA
jgi:hypothetical protein